MAKRKLALLKQDGEVYYITDSDAQSKLLEVNRKFSDYATTSELTEMDTRLRSEINSAKFDGEYSSLKGTPDLSQYITEEKLNEKAYATKKELDDLKLSTGTFTINDEAVGESSTFSSKKISEEYALKSEIGNVDLTNYATKDELNNKANATDVYTKTEIDEKGFLTSETLDLSEYAKVEALNEKANSADVYTKNEVDNKGFLTNDTLDLSGYATKEDLDKVKLEAGAFTIDDNTAGTSSTYSSEKINSTFALKSEIVNPDLSNYATKDEIPTIPESLPASDVYEWAKAETKPNYTTDEISGLSSQLETVNKNISSINSILEENYLDITFTAIVGAKIARVIDEATTASEDITIGDVDNPSFQLTKFNGREDLVLNVVPEEGYTINENSLIIDGDYEKVKFDNKTNQYTIKNISGNLTCSFIAESGNEVGFTATFEPIDGEIDICATNNLNQVVETLSAKKGWTTQTRHKDTGLKTNDGDNSQVNFIIRPNAGYSVKSVKASGTDTKPYNKIKNGDAENSYTITKVNAPSGLTISITLEAIEKTLSDYFIKDAYTKTDADSTFAKKADIPESGAKINDSEVKTDAVYSSKKIDDTYMKLAGGDVQSLSVAGNTVATQNWVEEKGYLTEHQSLDNYATISYVQNGYVDNSTISNYALKTDIPSLAGYQETLISGTNIKTINEKKILGEGNIEIIVPTKESDLTADRGYITSAALTDYAKKTDVSSAGYLTANDISNKADKATTLAGYGITDAYTKNDIDGKIITDTSKLTNGAGFITSSALTGYATQTWVQERGYLTEHQPLTDYAKKSEVPTKVAELTDASSYATTIYVSGEIAKVKQFSVMKVDSFDDIDIADPNVLYLIPKNSGSANNVYNEYLYLNNNYELIGDTAVSLDGYAKLSDIPKNLSYFTNDAGYLKEHQSLDGKQDKLVSGTNIKTINGNTILGAGDIEITIPTKESDLTADRGYATETFVNTTLTTEMNKKQNTLVSGTNIRTVNGNSLVGSGDVSIAIPSKVSELENDNNYAKKSEITDSKFSCNC